MVEISSKIEYLRKTEQMKIEEKEEGGDDVWS